MITESKIATGVFAGYSVINCTGQGTYKNSQDIKRWCIDRIAAGERLLLVDLEGCSGMDSTFMGVLVGISGRATSSGCEIHVTGASQQSDASLRELGVNYVLTIDAPDSPLQSQVAQVRSQLTPMCDESCADRNLQAEHMYAAHQELTQISEHNAKTFSGLMETLKRRLTKKTLPSRESKP